MFKKRSKIEVVPGKDYTDYSDRFIDDEKYATLKQTAIMASIPAGAALLGGISIFNKFNDIETVVATIQANQAAQAAQVIQQPLNAAISQAPGTMVPATAMGQPTGFLADKSLEVLAAALDPVIQILVAISFPIASVIMVGACFFFMIGNTERAWTVIMNAGLGYILIQMSPMFLEIIKAVGAAV